RFASPEVAVGVSNTGFAGPAPSWRYTYWIGVPPAVPLTGIWHTLNCWLSTGELMFSTRYWAITVHGRNGSTARTAGPKMVLKNVCISDSLAWILEKCFATSKGRSRADRRSDERYVCLWPQDQRLGALSLGLRPGVGELQFPECLLHTVGLLGRPD